MRILIIILLSFCPFYHVDAQIWRQAGISANASSGDTLLPPSSAVATAGDGKIKVIYTSVEGATLYQVEAASDSLFTVNKISASSITTISVVDADNDSAKYVRVRAINGTVFSAWLKLSGTYTATYSERLTRPVITAVIPVNDSIYVAVDADSMEDQMRVEVSTSPYFATVSYSNTIRGPTGKVKAGNDTGYFVRVTGQSDLKRDAYSVFFEKSKYSGYNTFTPHVINDSQLHAPTISEYLILDSTTLKIDAFSGDLRAGTYTAELHTSTAYAGPVFTVTNSLDNLIFSGLTPNTPYRLRLRSNGSITSSSWVNFPDFVISGKRKAKAKAIATGDSNTTEDYVDPVTGRGYPRVAASLVDTSLFSSIQTAGVSSSETVEQIDYEYQPTTPNWAGLDTTIDLHIWSNMYPTNDFTVKGRNIAFVIPVSDSLAKARYQEGFKGIIMRPGIPYSGGSFGGVVENITNITEYTKCNWKRQGYYAHFSFLETEELNIARTGNLQYWLGGTGAVHYTQLGYDFIGVRYAALLNAVGQRIFVRPPPPVSLAWNSGTQNLTIVLPSGYEAGDAEISLNYDGIVGFKSNWTPLSSLVQHITATQPVGSVAVRIRVTRSTVPSLSLLNVIQYN